jgi:HEAT repeat protein
MKLALLGVGAVAVLGAGLWIGRASQSKPLPAPQAQLMETVATNVTMSPKRPALQRPAVAPDLAADLKDANPKVRATAVREASDADVFRAAVHDRALEVGIAGADGLARLHASGEVGAQEMIAIATDHTLSDRVRLTALNGLGLVPSADAARTLAELVHRGDQIEKRSAAILLAHQDAEVAVPALIDALADADEVVRSNAAEALRGKARGRDFGTDAAAWRGWWQSRSR